MMGVWSDLEKILRENKMELLKYYLLKMPEARSMNLYEIIDTIESLPNEQFNIFYNCFVKYIVNTTYGLQSKREGEVNEHCKHGEERSDNDLAVGRSVAPYPEEGIPRDPSWRGHCVGNRIHVSRVQGDAEGK